jgi:hypothetical protein
MQPILGQVRMSSPKRTAPPAEVQRILRQEAGFGCCRCGYPFYQYHHIVPWHKDEHYRAEDMMILCPNCHDEVTNGQVPESEQREWKAKPRNIQDGHASGRLRIDQKNLVVILGGSRFVDTPVLLQLNGEDMIGVKRSEDGRLLVSTRSYDEDDKLLFSIINNEWDTGADLPWDLKARWRHVLLRHKRAGIGFEIDARQAPVKMRGTFWKSGHRFTATKNQLSDQYGRRIEASEFTCCQVGIVHRTH